MNNIQPKNALLQGNMRIYSYERKVIWQVGCSRVDHINFELNFPITERQNKMNQPITATDFKMKCL